MPILRSIPSKKIINGIEVKTSEVALISESNYTTTGEYAIVIKTVEHCDLLLDSKTAAQLLDFSIVRDDNKMSNQVFLVTRL